MFGGIKMAFEIQRKLFTVEQYYQLAEIGVLDWDERLELIEGVIMTMHPTTRRDDYLRLATF